MFLGEERRRRRVVNMSLQRGWWVVWVYMMGLFGGVVGRGHLGLALELEALGG